MKKRIELLLAFCIFCFVACEVPSALDTEYIVSFDSQGGTKVESQLVKDGNIAASPCIPSREGYSFVCWLKNGEEYDFSSAIHEDTKLVAKWVADEFTVTFNTSGGTTILPQKVSYCKTLQEPEIPTKTGYTFSGWEKDGKPFSFDTIIKEDFELEAVWTANLCTVEFIPDNGTENWSVTVPYGEKIQSPEKPEKTNYTFDCWKLREYAFDFDSIIYGDTTLTASWKQKVYNLQLDPDNGEQIIVQQIPCGESAGEPQKPSKTGYVFKAWSDGDNVYSFPIELMGDLSLKALWEPIKYMVSFWTDGGTAIPSQFVSYRENAAEPDIPVKYGYTFNGWKDGENAFSFSTVITENKILEAVWVPVEFEVSFDTDGGTSISSLSKKYGEKVEKPAVDPCREGYVFDGWKKDDGTDFDFESEIITSNTVITAAWIRIYKIGDTGPAGGIIFYDCDADNTEQDPDGEDNLLSTSCGWRYMEVSPKDLSATFDAWGQNGSFGTKTGIGEGKNNTLILKNDSTGIFWAAESCAEFIYGGYSDWFLPSKDELHLVYLNVCKQGKGGEWYLNGYLSSSEGTETSTVWYEFFYDEGESLQHEGWRSAGVGSHVRPIRSFL